jgi:glycosyltransferase involved in cell wall biosynthesis
MKYIFSSPYYLNNRATGANKRFERILYELQGKYEVGIIVSKGQVPLDISSSVSVYEIPIFVAERRLLTFIYLNFLYLYFAFCKNVLISDFNPIPVSCFFSKRQFQLIHDARLFDGFGRWSKLSSLLMRLQWKYVKNKIVVSQFTKDCLCKELSIKESSVVVSFNGILPSDFDTSLNKNRGVDLLYVATFEERKNHINLVKALSLIDKPLTVTFLGKDLGLKSEVEKEALKLECHKVTFLDSISEAELAELYRNSKIFISPSLYEGFGMPILEAYAYGCKINCSDISVFHEVLGKKATYFTSEDICSISTVIEQTLLTLKYKYNPDVVVPGHFYWKAISDRLISDIESLVLKQ